ncbi:MAG: hypothetical protein AAF063_15060 [Cyanobacteria bacterium J06643_5]
MNAHNPKSKAESNSQVSEEIENFVENNIPNASETIKQKIVETMDAVRKKTAKS